MVCISAGIKLCSSTYERNVTQDATGRDLKMFLFSRNTIAIVTTGNDKGSESLQAESFERSILNVSTTILLLRETVYYVLREILKRVEQRLALRRP